MSGTLENPEGWGLCNRWGPRVAVSGTGQAFSFWSKRCIWSGATGCNTRLADCFRLVAAGDTARLNVGRRGHLTFEDGTADAPPSPASQHIPACSHYEVRGYARPAADNCIAYLAAEKRSRTLSSLGLSHIRAVGRIAIRFASCLPLHDWCVRRFWFCYLGSPSLFPKPGCEVQHPSHDACVSAKALLCSLSCLTQHLLELMPIDQHATGGMLPVLLCVSPHLPRDVRLVHRATRYL